jgi:hypothetical protein
MRQVTGPVTDKSAASDDPAVVKVYREALDKAHASVR